jgi:hypothetical protein
MSFVTLSKENLPDSEVGASSKKRLANPEVPDSTVPLKYVLDIPVYFLITNVNRKIRSKKRT